MTQNKCCVTLTSRTLFFPSPSMEEIFKAYEIPSCSLNELLYKTKGIIAGSAPLSALLTSNKKESFEPGDIDIWIWADRSVDGVESEDHRCIYTTLPLVYEQFLSIHGYKKNPYEIGSEGYNEADSMMSTIVRRVDKYYNKKKKCIQIILTKVPPIECIKTFDLSCCMTWWEPVNPAGCYYTGKLYTYDPERTLNHQMYFMREKRTDRESKRRDKYDYSRGFIGIENPHLNMNSIESYKHSILSIDTYKPVQKMAISSLEQSASTDAVAKEEKKEAAGGAGVIYEEIAVPQVLKTYPKKKTVSN